MEHISTTSLANVLDISAKELFEKLTSLGWIQRKSDKWVLTEMGKQKGGQTRMSTKFGEYIVWPENISLEVGPQSEDKSKLLNATTIGQHFNISSQRLNLILSEFGWIEKDLAGWAITKLGKSVGGKQFEHAISGATYVFWPDSILSNKSLNELFLERHLEKEMPSIEPDTKFQKPIVPDKSFNNFRDKFPPTFRTRDGHMVRSRAEVIIDNALYEYRLAHAYERKLPIEEELYSDFYIPSEMVYIEFWGMENDPHYLERKKVKLEIYKKYDSKLIELTDEDILNLDDHLPKKLLKFGIKVF